MPERRVTKRHHLRTTIQATRRKASPSKRHHLSGASRSVTSEWRPTKKKRDGDLSQIHGGEKENRATKNRVPRPGDLITATRTEMACRLRRAIFDLILLWRAACRVFLRVRAAGRAPRRRACHECRWAIYMLGQWGGYFGFPWYVYGLGLRRAAQYRTRLLLT